MPRDMKSPMKKEVKHNTKKETKPKKKEDERSRNRKSNEQSDSDNDEFTSEDSDEEEDDDDEMDHHEYQKLLAQIFPSKYMNKKVKAGEKLKQLLEDEDEEEEEEEEEQEEKPKKGKSNKTTKTPVKGKDKGKVVKKPVTKSKKQKQESDDEEEDDDDYEEYEDDEPVSNKKINIIFTIGQSQNDDEDEWLDEEDSEWEDIDEETEDEDESVSSDDSSDDDEDEDDEEDEEEDNKRAKRASKKAKKNEEDDDEEEDQDEEEPAKKRRRFQTVVYNKKKAVLDVSEEGEKDEKEKEEKQSAEEVSLMQKLKELQVSDKENKVLQECLQVCKSKMLEKKKKAEKKQKKQKEKNSRIFKRILRDKNTMNDFTFFEKMTTEEQVKIIKEVREINKITRIEKPYRMTLLESAIPPIFKAAAMKKINSLRYMEPGSGEFYKIKNWVDTFMRIPFNKFEKLPISIEDGVDVCHQFMENAQKTLDAAVYGLNDAKMQIMQMLGQLITNPTSIGTAIAIHGPPGTGKTSLVKEGISKILNRPFAFIALGGATDSSFLEGHSYTYEGSIWGKIVQILIDSKCMNPVIYFDELDKISGTPKGEEIAGILTHLTDTSQNTQFHDKYFAEIDFDLSKCLFIFSYNDESLVNPILKDRMYRIQTKGYEKKQKTVIAQSYLLPKIRDQVKFRCEDVIIPEESIHHIIETHCCKEDGVRNLKRCLEIIHTKLNLYRLMKPGTNLFEEEMMLKVEFPLTVTRDIVDKLIKRDKNDNVSMLSLYI